jgi:hypothetical protein
MASGHVNRIRRPNTWLHRPMLQNVKKVLTNSEPSTHGRKAAVHLHAVSPRSIAQRKIMELKRRGRRSQTDALVKAFQVAVDRDSMNIH